MPRKRRPSPGQGASSGGGFPLGQLLMAAFGGVQANPAITAAGASEFGADPSAVGVMTPEQGNLASNARTAIEGGQFFKPKTIFDRSEASRMNADFLADQYTADTDVTRALKQRQGESDIDLASFEKGTPGVVKRTGATERERLAAALEGKQKAFPTEREHADILGKDVNTRELAQLKEKAALEEVAQRNQQVLAVLQAKGIAGADAKMIADAIARINEPAIQEALAKSGQATSGAELGEQKNIFDARVHTATQPSMFNKATSDASVAEQVAKAWAANNADAAIQQQVKQPGRLLESQIRRNSTLPFGQEGAFDLENYKMLYNPADKMAIGETPASRFPPRPAGRQIDLGEAGSIVDTSEMPVVDPRIKPIGTNINEKPVTLPTRSAPLPTTPSPQSGSNIISPLNASPQDIHMLLQALNDKLKYLFPATR